MTMTKEQLEALMQYIGAVASMEAVLASHGTSEGGYDKAVNACADQVRRLFLAPNADITGR